MSDQFWSSVIGSLVGALAAGIISAVIAWRVFAAERELRNQEQREAARQATQRMRSTAVSELITVLREERQFTSFNVSAHDGTTAITTKTQNAAQTLLLDGTEESYTVYQYVISKLRSSPSKTTTEAVIAMLIAWIRNDKGAIESMKRRTPTAD